MDIRPAQPSDAPEVCRVLRRSITELCQVDHNSDPAILNKWLASKTPANVTAWIKNPRGFLFVAIDEGVLVGVGGITAGGEITLNYVSPDARFRGVSKALLAQLEAKAVALGHTRCTLTSTLTARRFYRSAGYVEDGLPTAGFFTQDSLRMAKALAKPSAP